MHISKVILWDLDIFSKDVNQGIEHGLCSSSSVYGGNTNLPFTEAQAVNHPVSLYAATKKANELMAHTYSHLYNLPATGLRFFTVYGPWGRPDMAPMLFAKAILSRKTNTCIQPRENAAWLHLYRWHRGRNCTSTQKPASKPIFDKKSQTQPAAGHPTECSISQQQSHWINEIHKLPWAPEEVEKIWGITWDVAATKADTRALESGLGSPSTPIEHGVEICTLVSNYYKIVKRLLLLAMPTRSRVANYYEVQKIKSAKDWQINVLTTRLLQLTRPAWDESWESFLSVADNAAGNVGFSNYYCSKEELEPDLVLVTGVLPLSIEIFRDKKKGAWLPTIKLMILGIKYKRRCFIKNITLRPYIYTKSSLQKRLKEAGAQAPVGYPFAYTQNCITRWRKSGADVVFIGTGAQNEYLG